MYSHEFKRDSGEEISVRYRYNHGSPDTYSPLYGADGGDPAEVDYQSAMIDGKDFDLSTLTESEVDRLESEIHEAHADDFFADIYDE